MFNTTRLTFRDLGGDAGSRGRKANIHSFRRRNDRRALGVDCLLGLQASQGREECGGQGRHG